MMGLIAYGCLWAAALAYVGGLVSGKKWPGQIGSAAAWLACLALGAGLVGRGLRAGHWPLASLYEFALAFVWATLLVYLLLEWTLEDKRAGGFILPVALFIYTYALLLIPPARKAARPLTPALQSNWLVLHGLCGAIAYGAFACAGGLAAMYLLKEFYTRKAEGADRGVLPALAQIERYMWRAVALGFPAMTLLIITGAVWAQKAWGSYWSWDIKEVWALITWFVYLLFLHARALRGWRGRPLALIALAGLAAVLFTFLGVGWLARLVQVESLHVF
jgi:cytochrome c-type biogenesis protein CcsB